MMSWLITKQPPALKIEHVFVLMLENRAFDHIFGLSQITGTDAITGMPATVDGVSAATNFNLDNPTDPASGKFPVSSPADFCLVNTGSNAQADPGHEFENVLNQLGSFKNKPDGSVLTPESYYDPLAGIYPDIDNSGFYYEYKNKNSSSLSQSPSLHPEKIMDCFLPGQLPVLNALAREFAICDNWFSSLPGPTWPNRFFMMAATSGGLDNSPSTFDTVTGEFINGFRFENGNIFDLLDANCIEWLIFEGDDFPVSFALSGMNLNYLQGRFQSFDDFNSIVSDPGFDKKYVFIEPDYGHTITHDGDMTCGTSMHPLDDVTRGENLIKTVYETIRNSPHWNNSVLLITFDEHGGFYDHVKPPNARDGVMNANGHPLVVPPGDETLISQNKHGFKFDQFGIRVPAIVVSPFIKKGTIDHTYYDHTSGLASLERLTGMGHLTNRDKNANDFLHLFSLNNPRQDAPATLPKTAVSDCNVCGDDSESKTKSGLIQQQQDLISARQTGLYRGREMATETTPSNMQKGFAYIGLLKVLVTAKYPDSEEWKKQFRRINTKLDVAQFLVESKLKIHFDYDVHKIARLNMKASLDEERRAKRNR
jgi:phospholipase C